MRFEFATSRRILFGSGTIQQLPQLAQTIGTRALVLTGQDAARHRPHLDALDQAHLLAGQATVAQEPAIADIQTLAELARAANADMVIAIGGGSVMDAGKAVAALLTNPGDLLDYLEVVGQGRALSQPAAPCIAVPTTAGTGAEVTRNAVLAVPPDTTNPDAPTLGVKVSLRSPHMLPVLALIDPELTLSVPPAITATTGMDALTQCLEPYLSSQANPLSDGMASEGLRRVGTALRRAYAHGDDLAAREEMSLVSLCGGLALANAKLGAVHGFAGVIGGMFPAPHGALCARLLPSVFAANLHAITTRGEDRQRARFDQAAQLLMADPRSTAQDAVAWLATLVTELAIPRLRDFGLTERHLPAVVQVAQKSSSMQGNPIHLSSEECTAILRAAL